MQATTPEATLIDLHDRIHDAYYGKMGEAFMRQTQDRIHWICQQVHGQTVLDVGCSQGLVPLLLAREGVNVTGIDSDPDAIRFATAQAAAEAEPTRKRLQYINHDFLNHEFQRKFDTVVMSEVLEHLTRPETFVDRAAELLGVSGRVVITVPFGINDFVDHKRTYYLLGPYRLLAGWFDITTVRIGENWIGLSGNRRSAPLPAASFAALDAELVARLESSFLLLERSLRNAQEASLRKLDETNKKYRASTEQVATLKQQLTQADTQKKEAAQRHLEDKARMDGVLGQLRAQLDSVNLKYRETTERHAELRATLVETDTRRKDVQAKLEEAQVRLAREQEEARLQVQQLESARRTLQQHESARRTLQQQLDNANGKYRESTAQYTRLKEKSAADHSAAESKRRELSLRVEQLQLEVKKERQALTRAKQDAEKLRNDVQAARNQVAQTRAMLSFQLGYALIHGFKSFKGFFALWGNLWRIYREAKRRRTSGKQKEHRMNAAQAATAAKPQMTPAAPDPVAFAPQARTAAPAPAAVPTPAPATTLAPRRGPTPLTKKIHSAQDLKALRIACIMDEFTFSSYRPECNLFPLTPAGWKEELASFRPEVLFIESAWRGKDDLWGNKVGHLSQEVQGILAWCDEHQVPTMFWNKEDPVHFDTFLNTARLFDHVFTTDIDCIHRYKAALGHERVWLLPFAAQPASFNPLETYTRKDAFCFAGAYYVRYPERTRDLGNFISHLASFKPVEIYDRNFGKDDPNYRFPEEYRRYIVGNLPFDQIDKAYKGYRYGINLNSIKQSQTMFARRVYELLASNTLAVSNFSRGVRLMFGDLVITSDSGEELVGRIRHLEESERNARRFRLAALRKVMGEHTYQDRLAYAVSRLARGAAVPLMPTIAVLGFAKTRRELDAIVANFHRQSHAPKRLLVVAADDAMVPAESCGKDVTVIPASKAGSTKVGELLPGADWISVMVASDHYGANYLLDLALATRYSTADVIGKAAHFAASGAGDITLHADGTQYRQTGAIPACRCIARPGLLENTGVDSLAGEPGSLMLVGADGSHALSIDEFNYCRDGAAAPPELIRAEVDDTEGLDTGLRIEALVAQAEAIPAAPHVETQAPRISGAQLAALLPASKNPDIHYQVEDDRLVITSSLPDGKHEYLYLTRDYRTRDLGFSTVARFHLDVSLGLNVQFTVHFLDAQKQRISHVVKQSNRNHEVEVPIGAEWTRIGLRVYASGTAEVRGLILGHRDLQPPAIIGKARVLLVTNHYPSYEDLYRNGFVHTRLKAYAQRGLHVDVFRLRRDEAVSFHEFQNVDAITGSAATLRQMLASGRYEHVLVHFLDEATWAVLGQFVDRIPVTVWVHGAEIQPFHRREFNFVTEAERNKAQQLSEQRVKFWQGLLDPVPAKLKLVFVSRYLADQVMEDLGIRIPPEQYVVIHNPIDTALFNYVPKPPEQRAKILSIRPYSSATYANDLSVRALLALKDKPWFGQLEIRMIGDGPLFESTLAPLRGLRNVIIEQRFLTREEIATLHKGYGVFLCPSRMDTHGVSRDEAMASGLVPATSAVGAIPEFVDPTCSILAAPEDADGLARGIEALYQDAGKFLAMSNACRDRVVASRATDMVIASELGLIGGPKGVDAVAGRQNPAN